MQKLQDFAEGLEHAGLIVGDFVFTAIGFDDPLRFFQIVARHVGEEMMLDLVVEATIPEIGEEATTYVARGQNLAA